MESGDNPGMDWKRIARYSLALVLCAFVVSLGSGLVSSDGVRDAARIEAIGSVVVFALYLAVFARMAAGSAAHPIAGAALAAFVATALSLILPWAASVVWSRVFAAPFDALAIAVEVALLALAATFGVGLGSYLRDRSSARAKVSPRDLR